MPSRPYEARELTVTLPGRFAVTAGGVPVPEASWKRRHAATLVKVLAWRRAGACTGRSARQ